MTGRGPVDIGWRTEVRIPVHIRNTWTLMPSVCVLRLRRREWAEPLFVLAPPSDTVAKRSFDELKVILRLRRWASVGLFGIAIPLPGLYILRGVRSVQVGLNT